MTFIFDENARKNHKRLLEFFEQNQIPEGTRASSLTARLGTVKEAREFIATYHYSKTMPDSTMEVCMGYYGDILAGICVFGMGAGISQYKAILPTIEQGQYRELTRLWSPDGFPKNTESRLISESIKLLPKKVKLLLSFADPNQGHLGTIYQATNWDYCGMTGGGKRLVNKNGQEFHSRLVGIYRMRHPELAGKTNAEIMKIYEWTYKQDSPKHRYVMIRTGKKETKKLREMYKEQILKYPKA